jgi:hypothetical protein
MFKAKLMLFWFTYLSGASGNSVNAAEKNRIGACGARYFPNPFIQSFDVYTSSLD